MERLKAQLEKEWGDGFFYGLRNGVFDENQYIRVKMAFEQFDAEAAGCSIDKRFVSLIWFIPSFVKWQEDRLVASGIGREKFEEMSNFFYNQCENILGLP